MKTCPVCETQNQDGAKNCECCGEPLQIPQSAPAAGVAHAQAPESPPSTADAGVSATAAASELATGATPASVAQPELGLAFRPTEDIVIPSATQVAAAAPPPEPAPTPAPPPPKPTGPSLVVFQNRTPAYRHFIVNDETLIGRADPLSGSFPDLDLTAYDPEHATSRKHAFVLRQEGKVVLRAISNAGTQLNQELLEMGTERELKDGDVVILGARIAVKFEVVR